MSVEDTKPTPVVDAITVEVVIAEVILSAVVEAIAVEVVAADVAIMSVVVEAIPAEEVVLAIPVDETESMPIVAAEVVDTPVFPLVKISNGYSLVLKSSSPVSTKVSPLALMVILPFP
jgi:hypothetical protein